jgi:hypothetical protein
VDLVHVVHLAAEIELYIFGTAFFIAVLILSLRTAVFIVSAALHHAFPGWRASLRRLIEYVRHALGRTERA